jgi:hypothetical protein
MAGPPVIKIEPATLHPRPNKVIIDGIGDHDAGLESADGMPHAGQDIAPRPAPHKAVARTADGRAVLSGPIDEVRDAVIDLHMIHLGDGKGDGEPRPPAVDRDVHMMVRSHDHAVAVQRVDPHIMMVIPAAGPRHPFGGQSRVKWDQVLDGAEVNLVGIVGWHDQAWVIMGTLVQLMAGIDELPVLSPVIGPPKHPRRRWHSVPWDSIAGFYQGVDASRIVGSHSDGDLPERRMGKAGPV